jgi:predicted dehydrogenase
VNLRSLLPERLKRALFETVVMPSVRRYDLQRQEKERRRTEARVPHWSRSERPGSKQTVRVGFVGAGQYARHHLSALASYEAVEIAALLTTGGPAAAEIAPQFGIERLFSDLDAFLAQDDLDCFVVVVPPRVTVEVASQCLATGRPVLLEKPPGVTSADTRALIRVADEAGTWGMVGLNRRFYSVVEHGLAALARLGAVRGAILEVPQGITADRQSGRLTAFDYDHFYVRNSIHDVDMLRYVLGDPIRVHSRAWPNAEFGNRAASFAAILEYGHGVTATVLDLWDTPDEARLKVVAEGGAVRWEKMRKGWVEAKGDPLPIPVDPVDERFRTGLWAQDLHFVEAVRSDREPALPAATLQDALGTMVLIERILCDSLGSAAAPEGPDPARASDPVQRAVLQPD